ncbi:MAG: S8 family serine peptidase [Phycisphaerales bacterium]|nr:S8 family serine peptidase [Phycisphaerales bacterium]
MSWLILTTLLTAQAIDPNPVAPELDVLVKLEPGITVGVDPADRWVLATQRDGDLVLPGTEQIRFIGPAALAEARDRALASRLGLDRWVRIQLEPGVDRSAFLDALEGLVQLEHAELDAMGGLAGESPDDPLWSELWNLQNTGQTVGGSAGVPGADVNVLGGAWDQMADLQEDIIVATLDSGAFDHVDLTDRVLQGRNIPNGTDDGIDVCASHGTHVAGIIAAQGDNGIGVAGMCWNARILPVVVVDPCGGPESWPADGLVWAADNGADIINMSLQYSTGTEYFHDAVLYAAGLDIPMVAATGNSNGPISYPARWEEVIAVGAITHQDTRWSSSNYGEEIDLVAPGYQITSTQLLASYGSKSGTSFAAPHVSGLVALLLSISPDLTNEEIRELLAASARDISLVGFDTATGHGCLDASAAIALLEPPGPAADLNDDGLVDGEDLLILLSSWGSCEGCSADFNGDGVVEGDDLLQVLSGWTS